jgi:hypothetical protein
VADYCSLAELKAALSIQDSVDDTLLESVIDAASRFVDAHCRRDFPVAAGTASRDYAPTGRYSALPIDDATTIVSVKIDDDLDYSFGETLVNDVDWQAEPLNGRAAGQDWPYTRLRPLEDGYWPIGRTGRATVRVEATYGWPAIPNAVKQATILQASRMFTRYDSPLGVAGFGEMGAMRVSSRVDPDVALLLEPFVRVTL